MRDSWWGGASYQAPQAGAFATAPQLLSHSQASPTPAPVLPCALSSPQHVPAAPGLLTRPPASLQEVVLLPSNSCSDLEVAALASRSGKTEYMHIHTHTCLCTHNSLPTCSHPPMRVHTRSPRGVGGEPVKHSVPLPPSPARVYKKQQLCCVCVGTDINTNINCRLSWAHWALLAGTSGVGSELVPEGVQKWRLLFSASWCL